MASTRWIARLCALALAAMAVSPAQVAATPLLLARAEQERGRLSLDEAAARVRRETGGKVLSGGTQERDGQMYYRFKVLLPSGQVRIILVDPGSGAMLE